MSEAIICPCGARVPWPKHSPPSLAWCGVCGRDLQDRIPPRIEFIDDEPVLAEAVPHWSQRMLTALLDPRSIQWMLMLGGGLMVLGLVIWLVTSKLFENPLIVAATLTAGSLIVHLTGCGIALRTRYKTAGHALTFLGCLLLPLNLWFYHAHDLLTLEGQLWIGGVICSAVYIATVLLLREPLFMYAASGGITLTTVLFLGQQGVIADSTWLSVALMVLAFISIHAERAFPPEGEPFSRKRFGLPLFWTGQLQLAAALVTLVGTQLLALVLAPGQKYFDTEWAGNGLTQHDWLAGALWVAGAYAYLYSDLVVRRLGWYLYAAVGCLIGAELTIIGTRLSPEWMIAIPAFTAVLITLLSTRMGEKEGIAHRLPPLALVLAGVSVVAGLIQHVLATSILAQEAGWENETGWAFFGTMVFVAVCNRTMSLLLQKRTTGVPAATNWGADAHVFLSAASALVAAAGLARCLEVTSWTQQAPLVMLVPLAYVIAARLWRGHSPEQPLAISAQVGAAVILLHVVCNTVLLSLKDSLPLVLRGSESNLWLGLVFAEAAAFYLAYAILFRKGWNIYLATAAACAAVWQLANFYEINDAWYTMVYAALGLILLGIAKLLPTKDLFPAVGEQPEKEEKITTTAATLHSANGLLSLALLSATLQALARLVTQQAEWELLAALGLTTLAGCLAFAFAPSAAWRRIYATCTIALAGVSFVILNVLMQLTVWQKAELFTIVLGLAILVASYIGRFLEGERDETDHVTLGLWFGSMLPAAALFIAAMYYRFQVGQVSLPDELGLLIISVLMLVTGYAWQLKSPAVIGGGALGVYLLVVIGTLAYFPDVAIGVYLAIGGGLLFGAGLALSIFRDRLAALPQKISNREGVFQVLSWR